MTSQAAKFLGLTNPVLRDCIDKLISTTMALQNSIDVMFGNLANWQAMVKPTMPPAPKEMQESVTCNTDDMVYNQYFKNAVNVIEEMKMAAFKAQQEEAARKNQEPEQRDYDPTVHLEKKKYIIDQNV